MNQEQEQQLMQEIEYILMQFMFMTNLSLKKNCTIRYSIAECRDTSTMSSTMSIL
jgi:hypothetical protein